MLFYLGLAAFIIIAIIVILFLADIADGLGALIGTAMSSFAGWMLFIKERDVEAVVDTESVSLFSRLQTELTPFMDYFLTDIAMTFIGIVLFGLLVFFAEAERLWSSVILVIVAVLVAQFVAGIAVLTFLFSNPIMFIAAVLVYLIAGSAYTTFWEWPKYCRLNVNPKALAKFLKSKGLAEGPASEDEYYSDPRVFKLHPKNHITRLGHMVLHWPFLLFWTLLHDPITWLYNFMYDLLGDFFLKIAVTITKTAVDASKSKTEKKVGTPE